MSLSDRETLELNELCDAVIEGSITDAQQERLESWLAASDDARQFYVQAMDLSASLGRYASEMQMGPADRGGEWTPRSVGRSQSRPVNWGGLALAASLLILAAAWLANRPGRAPEIPGQAAPQLATIEYVARITGGREAKWKAGSEQLAHGAFLSRKQRLALAAGFAEITFDSGAVVLLEGPATLDVNSAWDATLRNGTLTAHVPPQAIGFRVLNRAVEVVDLGTAFSMVAESDGAADVLVLDGEIEAVPRGPESETLLLKTNESRRFARANVTALDNADQMIARFQRPVPLDRPGNAYGRLRWAFDAVRGREFPAEAAGVEFSAEAANLRVQASSPRARDQAHVDGFRGRGARI